MNITVLFGTETGNTEMLAEDLQSHLEGDHDVDISNLSDFSPADFTSERFYLVLCSTYGDGELPASAQPFADALTSESPDLSGTHFAMFGLGDSEYSETHHHGSQQLLEMLVERGAVQVGEKATHDASGADMADDLALPWADEVIVQAEAVTGASA